MKLWLLRPVEGLPEDEENNPWEPWFDKTFGFVVRAENEQEARKLANAAGGRETGKIANIVYRTGGDPWLDPKFSTCTELVPEGEAEVIIRDHQQA